MESVQVRDLTVLKLFSDDWLVFAIDSLTGIGEHVHDEFAASPEEVGYFTARVVLFEVLASGTTPRLLINASGTGGSYGERIVIGIREALQEAGFDDTFPITGSSEKNIRATITTLSVTAIGSVDPVAFRPGTSHIDDEAWLVGVPKSAPQDQVSRGDTSSVSFAQLRQLLTMNSVREVLPIGSRGAVYEAHQLANSGRLRFVPEKHCVSDTPDGIAIKSGGPSTAVLATGRLSEDPTWHRFCQQIPCLYLGRLEM